MKNGVVKFAIVMTVLAAIGAIATKYKYPAELVGDLTLGSIANFVLWLIVGAIAVWVKEKLWGGKKSAVSTEDNHANKTYETKVTTGIEPLVAGQDTTTKKCPECSRDNLVDVVFCSYCGHKFGLICPNCARENLPDSNICGYCGSQLRASAQPIVPASDYPSKQSPAVNQQNDKTVKEISEGKTKAWNKKIDFWIAIVVIAAVLLVVYLLYLFGAFGNVSFAAVSPTATKLVPTATARPTENPIALGCTGLFRSPGCPTQDPTALARLMDPCVRADKIDRSYSNKTVCVFGIVYNAYHTIEDIYNKKGAYVKSVYIPPFVISFVVGGVALESSSSVSLDVKIGDCIEITGIIRSDKNGFPYMDPDIGDGIKVYNDPSRCN